MPTMLEKIEADIKDAMRARDELRLSTLRMLKSAIGYIAIEKKLTSPDDSTVIAAIQKQIKQRRDAIEGFEKGGRTDQAAKEKTEMTILEAYLPKGLSDDELSKLVDESIAALGAKTKSDMGKVMKEVMAKSAGRADGKKVSALVSSKLA